MKLTLPYPPSVNRYYRMWRGRMLISADGRAYRRRVEGIMLEARCEPLGGALSVEIDVYPPDRRRRDIDNVLKALLDALEHGGAYADDNQITRLVVHKRGAVKGGRVEVDIERKDGDL